jgi:arsenate reductase
LRPETQGGAKSFEEAFTIIQANPILLERPFAIDWDRKIAVLGHPDISRVESWPSIKVKVLYLLVFNHLSQ